MRRAATAAIAAAVLGAGFVVGAAPAGAVPHTARFQYQGVPEDFVVPAGVTEVTVEACGASGSGTDPIFGFMGGVGGRARSVLDVTPGEVLRVRVGGGGGDSGWNGGAGPAGGFGTGGFGGGASDVRRGGDALADRVVIGGGGGGAGFYSDSTVTFLIPGGHGGGLVGHSGQGGGGSGGTQTGPGPLGGGGLGVGGPGEGGPAGGGGGGLYGGGGGSFSGTSVVVAGGGGGGSGFGHELEAGACAGGGYVTITWEAEAMIRPFGVAIVEGDSGTKIAVLPVHLSAPLDHTVTVDWAVADLADEPGLAQLGSDVTATSGTVTFAPGQTTRFVPLGIIGDTADEPDLLWGEWGIVAFSNPTGAPIDTSTFFGLGLFIIFDDD